MRSDSSLGKDRSFTIGGPFAQTSPDIVGKSPAAGMGVIGSLKAIIRKLMRTTLRQRP